MERCLTMNEPDWLTQLVASAEEVDGCPAVRCVVINDYKEAIRVLREEMLFINDTGKPRSKADELHLLKRGSGALVTGRTTNGQIIGEFVAAFTRDDDPKGDRHAIFNLYVAERGAEDELSDCAESLYEQYKEILDRASLGDIHRDPHRPF
jgi:hypothetical protein